MMITVGIDPHMKTHTAVATAGAARFASEAAFTMHDGTAPLPVSSGKSERHRLNRTGNRTLDSAIHMVAVTRWLQARWTYGFPTLTTSRSSRSRWRAARNS